jgi:carnitine-CoA ligase
MRNVSELIVDRARRFPDGRWSMTSSAQTLGSGVDLAARCAVALGTAGWAPGTRVAVIGSNSDSYLVGWGALQLAGCEAALINPTYPPELLAEMLANLRPHAVMWVGAAPVVEVAPDIAHLDAAGAASGSLVLDGQDLPVPAAGTVAPDTCVGMQREPGDIAGYMHTSGTTGTPKFCTQTHEYFLRLGRFIADSLAFSERDVVFAPLPLFHINPLGYGVVGALTAGASFVSTDRFSASRFWSEVRDAEVTAMILHAPPVEILKRATTGADAAGHKVRVMFYADAQFLEEYDIPLGASAYGSTESGGLSHIWLWRQGEHPDLAEGMSRYGGRSRHDLEWDVSDDGEILLRPKRANVMFDGYRKGDETPSPYDDDGWFRTGDLGRIDAAGNLVFIERRAESIRVKGEFVPIGYVEDVFSKIECVDDVAVWRRPSPLVDDEVTLYVVSDEIDFDALRAASATLPAFMRPTVVLRVDAIPRDSGVGKIRRRQLGDVVVLEEVDL